MELFVLSVAAGVLARIIGDAIKTGRRKAETIVLIRLVQEVVRARWNELPDPSIDIDVLSAKAVSEIRVLASNMPGVKVESSAIDIESVTPRLGLATKRKRNEELQMRMALLDAHVERRQKELALDTDRPDDGADDIPTPSPPTPEGMMSFQRPTASTNGKSIPGRVTRIQANGQLSTGSTQRRQDQDIKERLTNIDSEIARREDELQERTRDDRRDPDS